MNAGDGKAEQWLISFTQQLRTQLPSGQYLLTHARKYWYLSAIAACLIICVFSSRRSMVCHCFFLIFRGNPEFSPKVLPE